MYDLDEVRDTCTMSGYHTQCEHAIHKMVLVIHESKHSAHIIMKFVHHEIGQVQPTGGIYN